MPFWNFFRDIFVGKGFDERRNLRIEEPKWENNDDVIDKSRYFRENDDILVFNDLFEVMRDIESQIGNIFINFNFKFDNEGNGKSVPSFTLPQIDSLRDEVLKPNNDRMEPIVDKDLDGQITVDNFSKVWNNDDKQKLEISRPSIFGSFMTKEYVRKPDGTIEQKEIVRDFEGNEETTITYQIGDKVHTIVTKKDKNGVETQIEDFSSINESEFAGEKRLSQYHGNFTFHNFDLNFIPWEKFFKLDPKL